MRGLRVGLHTCTQSMPVCVPAVWGVFLSGWPARARPLHGLGSLPPQGRVFTHYTEDSLPLSFSPVRNLMKTQSKQHGGGLPTV